MEYISQYFSIVPQRRIVISELYTVHYFENFKDYLFPGERHNFWELLYVDRGEIIVETDRLPGPLRMEQGDLLLHRPNEFHSFYANAIVPHNLIVVSFASFSSAMSFFQEHPFFSTDSKMRVLISRLLEEARASFSSPLGDPNIPKLTRQESSPFGSEQALTAMLELLLIELQRHYLSGQASASPPQSRQSNSYVQTVITYMKENLTQPICLDDICLHAAISRSQIQKIFRAQTGTSVMRYLAQLRIEEAKFLIRRRSMTFTEIAERLCYSSVHHFSKQFHQLAGMSPSDYVASISSLTEGF